MTTPGAGAQRRHGAARVVDDLDVVAAGAGGEPARLRGHPARPGGARHRRHHGAEPLGEGGVGRAEAAVDVEGDVEVVGRRGRRGRRAGARCTPRCRRPRPAPARAGSRRPARAASATSARSRRRLGEHALEGRRRCAPTRTARSARARPAAPSRSRSGSSSRSRARASVRPSTSSGLDQHPGVAGDLGGGGAERGDDGGALGHGLEHGEAEALLAGSGSRTRRRRRRAPAGRRGRRSRRSRTRSPSRASCAAEVLVPALRARRAPGRRRRGRGARRRRGASGRFLRGSMVPVQST